ncbi:transporter [Gordonibacter sp. An230]|uniref:EamA family transporter n=1 Tax=Gordonibacter sp. An230 TaxID=1965592 RepID=UPI000B37536C|nr:transporter [Gordonibacter sp. An230]OUO85833.1 transporter [Gordonibacter sp. An230]
MVSSRGGAGLFLALHVLLVFYSVAAIFSKLAAQHEAFSPLFCAFYLAALAVLAIYAVGWQQVLKRLPLTTAFANKAATVVWGMVWGVVVFGESLTPGKLAAAAFIVSGVVLFSSEGQRDEKGSDGR